MRNFTFKGLFLTAVFTLLGCLSIQAANDDLITKQITIKLDEAGTLPNKIGSSKMYKITNLKIIGEINGTVYVPKGTYDDYWISEFGYFENIVEFDATGIDKTTTSSDVEEVSRYSVNGQRLVGPTKGLNIVKYSDGSVKKVAVE